MIIPERACEDKAEAQALANFLWNEKERHLDDVAQIECDLRGLFAKWNVRPALQRWFVKP